MSPSHTNPPDKVATNTSNPLPLASTSAAALELTDVCFSYPNAPVMAHLDLRVEVGEVVAVMGESGSGKTTLARLISGFLLPDSGTITLGNTTLFDARVNIAPHKRGIGLVPQEGALFPHLSVAQNIGFGLDRKTRDRERRIAECLELVGLSEFGNRQPNQLSGGQQQRVAVARALAPRPSLVILDEPFSALDAVSRRVTRTQVLEALRTHDATVVLVTHDSGEALLSADRVAALESGEILQVATPEELYDNPASLSIAQRCGRLTAVVAQIVGSTVETPLGTFPKNDIGLHNHNHNQDHNQNNSAAIAWIRPEHISVQRVDSNINHNVNSATVSARAIDGPDQWLTCSLNAPSGTNNDIVVRTSRSHVINNEDQVTLQASRVTALEYG